MLMLISSDTFSDRGSVVSSSVKGAPPRPTLIDVRAMMTLASSVFQFSLFIVAILSLRVPIREYDQLSARRVLKRLPSWINEQFAEIRIKPKNKELPERGEARIEFGDDGRKYVYASSPVDALYAVNAFLRTECLTQITWTNSSFSGYCRKRNAGITVTNNFRIRYFGNMCTFSYSFVWWQWSEWERFIDWLALNGFNTILMPLGQEYIWRNVFVKLGVSRKSLDRYFTSQAYLAWHRMGNLKGYGGGLSDMQLMNDLNLAQKIVERMLELGMVPILPTFAGFVPDEMEAIYPSSKFHRMPTWNRFDDENSGLLAVDPKDQLFERIGIAFLDEQKRIFGDVSHIYSADPFNEITPSSSPQFDAKYLEATAQAILNSCLKVDKSCIWLTQSWAFSYDKWPNWAIKSFLTAIPVGRLLVVDLYAEMLPGWATTSQFYGHNFIWGFLHNFGGSRELRGNIKAANKGYQLALENTNMIGAGLTMEAIDQNYVIYQFMIDRMWSAELIPINQWIHSYAESRYSSNHRSAEKLWSMLERTFYSEPARPDEPRFEVFLYRRPGFGKKLNYWFPIESVFSVIQRSLSILTENLSDNPLFMEDWNDLMRSILQYEMANNNILGIYEAYLMEDKPQIGESCDGLMRNFEKLERISNNDFKSWKRLARSLAATVEERKIFTISSGELLTTWGPRGENLDYAHREWSGLIKDYYAKRWEYFCEWILENDQFNHTEFSLNIFKYVERPFSFS
ncbi:unnamed protein product [Caenorhabditis bovis]|uniref:Alpha-N-acetylglucosaminidase n=1 Tax=Caenorhabditis bovis TaxID=2654633 RepID=A0A8S1ERR2_9PELO|nr:unnamed protein product [Caenorhabditis bovis]